MGMQILSTECTEEQTKEDMPHLLAAHKRALMTDFTWTFFGGVVTLDNGHEYQVAEFE